MGEDLHGLLKRRDELIRNIQRIEGMQVVAQQEFQELQEECRQKKINPEELGSVIERLEQAYKEGIEVLSQKIQDAEEAVLPFLEISRNNT